MAKSRKAELSKRLRDLGVTPDPKLTVADMEEMITSNLTKGYIVRLLKPANRLPEYAVDSFSEGDTFWVGDNAITKQLIETRLFLVLQRCFMTEVPKGVRVVRVG